MSDYYDEGWDARRIGVGREDNPYPFNVPAYSDWDLGWYEADYFYEDSVAKEDEIKNYYDAH